MFTNIVLDIPESKCDVFCPRRIAGFRKQPVGSECTDYIVAGEVVTYITSEKSLWTVLDLTCLCGHAWTE